MQVMSPAVQLSEELNCTEFISRCSWNKKGANCHSSWSGDGRATADDAGIFWDEKICQSCVLWLDGLSHDASDSHLLLEASYW
jgi:hypothetical protein